MTIIFHFHSILIFIEHRWSKDVIENTEFKVCNFFSIFTFIVNGFFLVLLANVLKKLKKEVSNYLDCAFMENALLEMILMALKDTLKLLLRLEKSTVWVTRTGAVTRVMKKNVSVQE